MTKQRTLLSPETLVALAQLKLHLRDETLKDGTAKQRVARNFETKKQELAATQPTAGDAAQGAGDEAPDVNDTTEGDASENASKFSKIAEKLMKLANEDEDHDVQPREAGSTQIHLTSLFDFRVPYWRTSLEEAAAGLVDELEIYDLTEQEAQISGQQELGENVLERDLDF